MKINPGSTRLAFFLIALLAIHIILSAIIPQKDITQDQITDFKELLGDNYFIIEKLRLDRIYTAPPFFILLGLIAISLSWGNISRIKLLFRSKSYLNRLRISGSIIFHISLLIIIAGVILNYLYKFEGVYALTEGQPADDRESEYHRIYKGPLYHGESSRFALTLTKIDSSRAGDSYTTGAELELSRPGTVLNDNVFIATNNPYRFEDIEFHYGLFSGYSPKLVFSDTTGIVSFQGYVRLAIQAINDAKRHADFIFIPDSDLRIEIELSDTENGLDSTIFKIMVEKDGIIAYEGEAGLNQQLEFDNYILSIPDLRRWCYINVTQSPYLNMIFWGFWSALAGLSIGLTGRTWSETRIKK